MLCVPDDGESVEGLSKLGLQTERLSKRRLGGTVILLDQLNTPHVVVASSGWVEPRGLVELSQRIQWTVRFEVAGRKLGTQLRVARFYFEPLLISCDVIAENLRAEVLFEPCEIGLPARHYLQPQRPHL